MKENNKTMEKYSTPQDRCTDYTVVCQAYTLWIAFCVGFSTYAFLCTPMGVLFPEILRSDTLAVRWYSALYSVVITCSVTVLFCLTIGLRIRQLQTKKEVAEVQMVEKSKENSKSTSSASPTP